MLTGLASLDTDAGRLEDAEADGRLKPDLVAPGERITSATTPAQLRRLGLDNPPSASNLSDSLVRNVPTSASSSSTRVPR